MSGKTRFLGAAVIAAFAVGAAIPASAECCPTCFGPHWAHPTKLDRLLNSLRAREANIIEIYGRGLTFEQIQDVRWKTYLDSTPTPGSRAVLISSGVRLNNSRFPFGPDTAWRVRYEDALLKELVSKVGFECIFDTTQFDGPSGGSGGAK